MKVRFYPINYDVTLLDMTKKGIDENGKGFYIIDVKEITGHEDNNKKLNSIIAKPKQDKKKQDK